MRTCVDDAIAGRDDDDDDNIDDTGMPAPLENMPPAIVNKR